EEIASSMLSKANLFGSRDTQELMIQEYIRGEEYVVNLVEKGETLVFDFERINRSGAILYFSNFYVDEPTHLDLSRLVSDRRLITFRPTKVSKDAEVHGDLFIKVSAVLYLSHFSSAQVGEDIKLLRTREENGSLFVR
ncbi:MAG TPA: hypothetical protein VIS99_03315, partial [Terrimicrobiaceae bacterium]